MTALAVGLTGGLASGKSTLGRWLAEEGFLVTDSDSIVAELYRPGAAGAGAVRDLFGAGVLDAEGGVDHAELARRVFSDPAARRRLEGAIHPLVRERFQQIREEAPGVAVLEVPLLVEAGMADDFDVVVTVESTLETRVRRAIDRGLDEEAARTRIAAQVSDEARRAAADIVIDNDGGLPEFRRQAGALAEELRERSRERAS